MQEEEKPQEEKEALLGEVAREVGKADKKLAPSKELYKTVSSSLDVFKGVLCFLMIYSHVDLCLVNPVEVYYTKLGHFVGNAASGMCFLGFVMSYGDTCYWAYLSDWTPRPFKQRLSRVVRSAILPIIGAWVCSLAWSYMCFKIPITGESFRDILLFYYVWGNGPDFLLSFTTMLLISFALRTPLNWMLGDSSRSNVRLAAAALVLLTFPMLLTHCVVPDCTGNRRYWQFWFPCDKREPVGMANLPALPHFFYFNIGILAAVGTKAAGEKLDAWREQLPTLSRSAALRLPSVVASLGVSSVIVGAVLAVLAYPLYQQWWLNYGNISAETPFGSIIRGWSRGPSPLWLLGNMCWIYMLLAGSLLLVTAARYAVPLLSVVTTEIEHYGANVLIYLVVSDCLLAGLYRPGQFPITAPQGFFATVVIMLSIRFIHYLGASGRK
jgi:hypothetical protein